MKVGDTVRQATIQGLCTTQPVYTIIEIKSDPRGLWIKFENDTYPDMWHAAQYYEVISETR